MAVPAASDIDVTRFHLWKEGGVEAQLTSACVPGSQDAQVPDRLCAQFALWSQASYLPSLGCRGFCSSNKT